MVEREWSTWRAIEDDFVLGACARRIVGFAARGADGQWSAFDDESQPLGEFPTLRSAQESIWQAHSTTHEVSCSSPWSHGWAGLAERLRRWRNGPEEPQRAGDERSAQR